MLGILFDQWASDMLILDSRTKKQLGLIVSFLPIGNPSDMFVSQNICCLTIASSSLWKKQTAIFVHTRRPGRNRSFLGTLGMPISRLRVGSKDLCPDGHGAGGLLILSGPHQEHGTVVAVALVVPGRKNAHQLLVVHQVEAQAIFP